MIIKYEESEIKINVLGDSATQQANWKNDQFPMLRVSNNNRCTRGFDSFN